MTHGNPTKQRYCKYCGGEINTENNTCSCCGRRFGIKRFIPQNKHSLILPLLIISICCNIILGGLYYNFYTQYEKEVTEVSKAQRSVELLRSQLKIANEQLKHAQDNADELLSQNLDLRDECNFFDENAVIVTTEGRKYHTYACWHWSGHNIYIYNIENAEAMGYTPCLDCH